jgi:hypothetical protein
MVRLMYSLDPFSRTGNQPLHDPLYLLEMGSAISPINQLSTINESLKWQPLISLRLHVWALDKDLKLGWQLLGVVKRWIR